ncbi:4-hydroxy-tetrahydrodipicolinate synthase [Pseudalkalibacillus sp. A8]|uniref:4-hydroxy-tetrahydrodipicolinate synthase n=1 Tax=Pseudalkalibacillus sp. A8 TaxID=3382641 RepID=UPI0038B61148
MNYEGIMTALVTPLTNQNEVDKAKFRDLINFQIESGVHSLLFLGGTGEYTSLSIVQKKEVIDLALKIVNGRVPVVIGLIDPGIGNTIDLGLYAKDAGVNALMIVTPYYVKPTQQGLINYYKKLDQTLDMSILLYNIPHKTGVNMLPTTVETIVNETSNIVGVKECTENFGQMVELINLVSDKITVLAGEEFAAVASMIFGAKGSVMASANVMPALWVKLYDLIRKGETEKAIETNKKYYSVFKAIFMEGNPGPLKTLLEMKGLTSSNLNLPLIIPSKNTKSVLKRIETTTGAVHG